MTTGQPHEQRCARCGQWWLTTHICSVQTGQVLPLPVLTPSAPVEVTTTDKLTAERDALRAEVEKLRKTIERVAAIAHCGGWVGLSEDQTIVYVRVLTVGSMPRGTLNASVAVLKEAVNAARAAQEGKT